MSGPRHVFSYDDRNFLLDGKPVQIHSGEIHYFRVPREYWRDRLLKAKALGLNTVCTYMPWNLHEPAPGRFDFSGMLDVGAFVRLAQELGLWVIVRPGPYICAEWDFGGLPAWLLAESDVRVRCSDDRYQSAVAQYVVRVGDELVPLCCTRGGPIVMVQVENEYGSYGNDRAYLRWLRDKLKQVGFDVALFTSDGSETRMLHAGPVEGCLPVVNFGSKAAEHVGRLKAKFPQGPAMCGEFWCGWFDQWGQKRKGSDSTDCVKDIEWMLDNGVSFNLYMFHGGTNFGFTSGANFYEAYAPTVTGYDYFALLDEAGRPTKKYFAIRELLSRRQPNGHPLPDLPGPQKAIEIPTVHLGESAALFEAMPEPVNSVQPLPMEMLGQYAGCILYRTNVAGLGGGKLTMDARDYAVVYLDGQRIGALRRDKKESSVQLPDAAGAGVLDILVFPHGRVNYGPKMIDRKGIVGPLDLEGLTLMGWQTYRFPLDAAQINGLKFNRGGATPGPSFHRGTFDVPEPGDTFLDLRKHNTGVVWVNGHNLGRYWSIGPQQTLYCPGVWLKPRGNEIVVFDVEGAGAASVAGLREPILDEVPAT